MKKRFIQASILSIIVSAAAMLPSGASAMSIGLIPQVLITTAASSVETCPSSLLPAAGSAQPYYADPISKTSAILGGRVSRLEQIALKQGANITGFAPTQQAGAAKIPTAAIQPCLRLAIPSRGLGTGDFGMRQASPNSSDFLGSRLLPIARTSFDAAWARVQRQKLPRGLVTSLSRTVRGQVNLSTLATVNAWTNTRVRYVEDQDLYGQADYWADARTTLQRRAGDCEDIAIAKLQLLAALGIPRSDMYLTVARDLARNADHAVLIVWLDGQHWLLDNSTDQVLDASASYDYRPIMSFTTAGKWLHGYSRISAR